MLLELTPEFDSRKSFYGKAKTRHPLHTTITELISYDTHVATIDTASRTVTLLPLWDSSATTLRHVKEFLKQHGFTAETKTQITRDYA